MFQNVGNAVDRSRLYICGRAYLHVIEMLLDQCQVLAADLLLQLINLVILHTQTSPVRPTLTVKQCMASAYSPHQFRDGQCNCRRHTMMLVFASGRKKTRPSLCVCLPSASQAFRPGHWWSAGKLQCKPLVHVQLSASLAAAASKKLSSLKGLSLSVEGAHRHM